MIHIKYLLIITIYKLLDTSGALLSSKIKQVNDNYTAEVSLIDHSFKVAVAFRSHQLQFFQKFPTQDFSADRNMFSAPTKRPKQKIQQNSPRILMQWFLQN